MISTRLLRPMAAAAFAIALVAGSPAHATDQAKVVGTGTITPGLPATGCISGQTVTFSGTAVLTGSNPVVYTFHFQGNSTICESTFAGEGCGVLVGDITGTVCYSRTGNVVTLSGVVVVQGVPHTIQAGACEFAPTSVNPVQTFALSCNLVLVSQVR